MAADELDAVTKIAERLLDSSEIVVHGKRSEVKLIVAALICGHALRADVSGTVKTVLARAIARSISGIHSTRSQRTLAGVVLHKVVGRWIAEDATLLNGLT